MKIKQKKKKRNQNESDEVSNNKKNDNSKECDTCHKIIKKKNFFYHDALIHNGENLSFKQKRALKLRGNYWIFKIM